MRDFGHFFGLAFSALLPLISPLRSAFLFEGLVGGAPSAVYRTLAHKIAINTTIFLLAILAMGTALLNFFGISLPVMQVAGGFVLAAMGWSLINQGESGKKEMEIVADSAQLESLKQKVFYPLTFPITVGPGCIVVVVTLSAHVSTKGMLPTIAAYAGIVTAVLFLSVAVYVCYGYAPAIMTRVSPQTVNGIVRVLAFVLLCIGVQIMWTGVEGLLKTLS
jgi:multiple antibiotic resistance protein